MTKPVLTARQIEPPAHRLTARWGLFNAGGERVALVKGCREPGRTEWSVVWEFEPLRPMTRIRYFNNYGAARRWACRTYQQYLNQQETDR